MFPSSRPYFRRVVYYNSLCFRRLMYHSLCLYQMGTVNMLQINEIVTYSSKQKKTHKIPYSILLIYLSVGHSRHTRSHFAKYLIRHSRGSTKRLFFLAHMFIQASKSFLRRVSLEHSLKKKNVEYTTIATCAQDVTFSKIT